MPILLRAGEENDGVVNMMYDGPKYQVNSVVYL